MVKLSGQAYFCLDITCFWPDLSLLMGLFFAVNLQIYLETSSLQRENVPKLPGVFRLLLRKTGHWPVRNITSSAIGRFLSSLLLKEQFMMISDKKKKKKNLSKRDHKALGGFEHKIAGFKRATFIST